MPHKTSNKLICFSPVNLCQHDFPDPARNPKEGRGKLSPLLHRCSKVIPVLDLCGKGAHPVLGSGKASPPLES